MRGRALIALLGAAGALAGCDPALVADAGPSPDASAAVDARVDPCAEAPGMPRDAGLCNGGPLGPVDTPDVMGGPCTPDAADVAGSCESEPGLEALCVPDRVGAPRCEYACAPGTSFIRTGGCPTGARCFTLAADFARCYRNCRTSADCHPHEECDREGSCVPRDLDAGPGPLDAGPLDAAVDLDAALDAGL